MAPPVPAVNGMMININITVEIDIDIEVTTSKIKIIKDLVSVEFSPLVWIPKIQDYNLPMETTTLGTISELYTCKKIVLN